MMIKGYQVYWKSFNELSKEELYQLLRLRQEVFILEQDCPYIDADNTDQSAMHLLCFERDDLVGYLRAFPEKVKYEYPSIGRVVIKISHRSKGLGVALMRESMDYVKRQFKAKKIIISAQYRLRGFYESLGFIAVGEIYLEDNIDHIEMHYGA